MTRVCTVRLNLSSPNSTSASSWFAFACSGRRPLLPAHETPSPRTRSGMYTAVPEDCQTPSEPPTRPMRATNVQVKKLAYRLPHACRLPAGCLRAPPTTLPAPQSVCVGAHHVPENLTTAPCILDRREISRGPPQTRPFFKISAILLSGRLQ